MTWGHVLLALNGGWMMIVHAVTVLPVYGVLVAVHTILVRVVNSRARGMDTSPRVAIASIPAIILVFLFPFTVQDFGDADRHYVPSRLAAWFGVSTDAAAMTMVTIAGLIVLSFVVLIVLDIVDLVAIGKRQRSAAPSPAFNVPPSGPYYPPSGTGDNPQFPQYPR